MTRSHHYITTVRWTGNLGSGTSGYRDYSRDHTIQSNGKPEIPGSSDPAFRGDKNRYNPEELLVSALSSCHMLWYLHLCAEAGIIVTAYEDTATGAMAETADGSGHFTEVVLSPVVTITDPAKAEEAHLLHEQANRLCFIANSVNFNIRHQPSVRIEPAEQS